MCCEVQANGICQAVPSLFADMRLLQAVLAARWECVWASMHGIVTQANCQALVVLFEALNKQLHLHHVACCLRTHADLDDEVAWSMEHVP